MTSNSIRRNPFVQLLEEILNQFGYKHWDWEDTKRSFEVTIQGFSITGIESTRKYFVPRTAKGGGRVLPNLKSQFKNFLNELPGQDFYPPTDHRVRKPGGTIAHINHDMPKKQLAVPNTIKREYADGKFGPLLAPPHIPDSYIGDKIIVEKVAKRPDEPLSTTMMLASFLVPVHDLSAFVELTSGMATFRGSRPAPLRITGETVKAPEPVAPPVPVKRDILYVTNVVPFDRNNTLKSKLLRKLMEDPTRVWKFSEIMAALGSKSNSLGATLSTMATNGEVQKISRGMYKAKA